MALGELSSAEDDATQQLIDVRLLVCDTLHQRHQQLQTHRDHSVAEPKIRAALFISEELGLTRDHTVSCISLSINCCINVLFTPAYISSQRRVTSVLNSSNSNIVLAYTGHLPIVSDLLLYKYKFLLSCSSSDSFISYLVGLLMTFVSCRNELQLDTDKGLRLCVLAKCVKRLWIMKTFIHQNNSF